jgi:hypothetical protein
MGMSRAASGSRRIAVAALLAAGLLAALTSSASAAAPAYNLLGTWQTGPLSGGVREAASGTQTVTQMNMSTGVFSGTSIVSGVHFALAGVESGNSVQFTQSEGSYAAHDKVPSLSILPDGHVGGNGSFEAGEFWMEVSAAASTTKTSEEESKTALRTPFVTVICNIFPSTPSSSTCTADVGDDGAVGRHTPTGTVTFSTTVGTFLTGVTCNLTPAAGLGAVSSCTLPFLPAPGTEEGAPLPVFASYSGDSVFSKATGSTSPVAPSLGSTAEEVASSGAFTLDLVNPNGASSAGSVGISSAGAAAASLASAAKASLASGSFHAGRFGVAVVHLKLSSAGRAELKRSKKLKVLVHVTSTVAGKKLSRSYPLTLRAGKH